jgi:hypothetical protein
MTHPSLKSATIGAVALTAMLAVAGCGSTSSSPASSPSSGSSGTQSTSFRQCLEQHGVTFPSGGFHHDGSTASPRPRPTGSRPAGSRRTGGSRFASIRQAIKACGGSGFAGG